MYSLLISSRKLLLWDKMSFSILSFLLIFFHGVNSGYIEKSPHIKLQSSNEYLPIACETDDECHSFILNSICSNNHCECTPNDVLSSDASKCLPYATEFGSPCEDNTQCSHILSVGGSCNDGRCACKTGYHYLKGSCWRSVELHGKCYRKEQCFSDYEYVGLECKGNVCKCRRNYYERLGSGCRRERKAGDWCNIDADCIDQSTCENMHCSPSNTKTEESFSDFMNVRLENKLKCSKGMFQLNNTCVRELGTDCTTNSDCSHIPKAVCLDDTMCACEPVLYVASEDNRQCLRVVRGKVEDIQRASCKNNPECGVFGGNSLCQNRRCSCKNGTYYEKGSSFCWGIKSLNEACKDVRDCHPTATHAVCVDTKSGKFCQCEEGYHQNGLDCFPDGLEVGDLCRNNDDCLFPNSFCNGSNICVCKERHYLENGKCVPGIGTSCSDDSDCSHLKNTECTAKKQCLCLDNYSESENYKYCLPNVDYKEECVESFQCKFPMGDQGECKNNRCECPDGEHYFNGKCYVSKFIGQRCSSLSECYSGSDNNSVICLRGFCTCNYDYELHESKICVKANSAVKTNVYFILFTFSVFLLTFGR